MRLLRRAMLAADRGDVDDASIAPARICGSSACTTRNVPLALTSMTASRCSFDRTGAPVDHELAHRTLALEFEGLRGRDVVLVAGGLQKVGSIRALLRTGVVRGLVIDGDAAEVLASA